MRGPACVKLQTGWGPRESSTWKVDRRREKQIAGRSQFWFRLLTTFSSLLLYWPLASGGGGNRTRVLWPLRPGFYVHSRLIVFAGTVSIDKAHPGPAHNLSRSARSGH